MAEATEWAVDTEAEQLDMTAHDMFVSQHRADLLLLVCYACVAVTFTSTAHYGKSCICQLKLSSEQGMHHCGKHHVSAGCFLEVQAVQWQGACPLELLAVGVAELAMVQ